MLSLFLLEKYQIFAVDILGQPNKSDFIRLHKKDTSYGEWLLEIIAYFKIDAITLYGISFGAFPILKSILIDETKVKEVFLISPAGFINGSLLKTVNLFFIPMLKFKRTKKEIYLQKCYATIYDEFDELNSKFLKEVFLNFKMDFSLTPNFKAEELSTLKVPITIIASENDFFVPAKKLKKKCEKHSSSLKNFIVLKSSKHVPSKRVLEQLFKKFTAQNDR
ncbi:MULTISPECIES: alpha/beta hydrolase [unclassified Polaribacter]|uniref:alpha/beta hydrolase n=1 Tax=unclassified Polaribacter TaxID=196858 RepID=UPI0011BF295C|nr:MULTISPECIES: alpha/beta hydrolase [unclassified Polaribacter]TXD53387.1 alpha/beta hydrolase [Polaribacter sp. IC063]TXD61511.1 alpha/beta hydrolase [Polaribacter sp. IC066]